MIPDDLRARLFAGIPEILIAAAARLKYTQRRAAVRHLRRAYGQRYGYHR